MIRLKQPLAAGSRSMKRNLDTGVEICNNKMKKDQRHRTNEKPNVCFNYFIKTNILNWETDIVLDMINAVYYDKPLVFIRAIRLGLSRLFLTLYKTR